MTRQKLERWVLKTVQVGRGPFMLLMLLFGFYGTEKFIDSPDGAAWIQCIWSVIAVSLALIAPGWQAQVQSDSDHARQMKLLASLIRFAEAHLAMFEPIKGDAGRARDFFNANHFPRFVAARAALADFPITSFKTVREIEDLMQVRAAMTETVHYLERAIRLEIAQDRAIVLAAHEYAKVEAQIGRLRGPDRDHISGAD